jgi:K+-transporting ATPase A subunit
MNKKQQIIAGLIAVVIAFIVFKSLSNSVKNFFATFGLGTSTSEDKTESQIEKTEKKANEFSPLYWQKSPKNKTSMLLTMAQTNQYLNTIKKAIGYIYDNPEDIVGVFRQLKYKTQISWLADNWQKKQGSDLQAWLSDKLDTGKQRDSYLEILSITKNLPSGYIKK